MGEGVDSLVFHPVAFFGVWDNGLLLTVMMSNYAIIGWEEITPAITMW